MVPLRCVHKATSAACSATTISAAFAAKAGVQAVLLPHTLKVPSTRLASMVQPPPDDADRPPTNWYEVCSGKSLMMLGHPCARSVFEQTTQRESAVRAHNTPLTRAKASGAHCCASCSTGSESQLRPCNGIV